MKPQLSSMVEFQSHSWVALSANSGVTLPFGAPLLIFFAAPPPPQKKKKRSPLFFRFFYRLLASLELFVPQIFFSRRTNAKLAEILSILLPLRTIFRLKNSKFGNMPPPCIAGVAGAVVTPLSANDDYLSKQIHRKLQCRARCNIFK